MIYPYIKFMYIYVYLLDFDSIDVFLIKTKRHKVVINIIYKKGAKTSQKEPKYIDIKYDMI